MKYLSQIDGVVAKIIRILVIAAMLGLFFLMLAGILLRAASVSMSGPLELVEFFVIWIVLLTAALLWREDELYKVSFLEEKFSGFNSVARVLIELLKLAFCFVIIVQGYKFAVSVRDFTPFWQFNKLYAYGAIPVCGCLMALYSVRDLVVSFRNVFSAGK